jgi:gliding motility-associated-like protein
MTSDATRKRTSIFNVNLLSAGLKFNCRKFHLLFTWMCFFIGANSTLASASAMPNSVATIDLNDTIFIDVSNAIVGAGFIDYPVYINSDDPIQSMDFQFFFNDAAFTYNSIINVAGIDQILGNVAPDVASGGFNEFRFTSNDLTTVYPNGSVLIYIRFNTASTEPCDINIVTNQYSVVLLGTISGDGGPVSIITNGCSNPPADAGDDQTNCSDSATVTGNAPLFGVGTWSLVSGSGTFQDSNSPTTVVTGLGVGANVLRWTLPGSGGSPPTSDEVTITRLPNPSTSNAGANQTVCLQSSALNAEAPLVGVGVWEVLSGTGVFEDASSPFSGVSGLSEGDNIFTWTISNGVCPVSVSQVIVFRKDSVFAGIDQTICEDTVTLDAAEATEGTGLWTVVSGSGTFADATLFNTIVTNLGAGENVFQWTITGSNCADSTDQVSIVIQCNTPPVIVNDQFDVLEDGEASGNVLDNGDNDPDGTALVVNVNPISGPSNGLITINADGSFIYNPSQNFYGNDTVFIEICDQGLPLPAICLIDTLVFTVLPVNDAPTIQNENIIVVAGVLYNGNVLDNDSDIENTTLTVDPIVVDDANNGVFTFNSDGSFSYTSDAGFTGFDTVIVSVCDSGFPLPAICVNDTIIFDVQAFTLVVFAGDDKTVCDSTYFLEGSEIPVGGSGIWTQITGTGVFVDPTLALAEVNELNPGENTFVWTVSLGNVTVSDTVVVTVSEPVAQALAGPDQDVCLKEAFLNATAPAIGTGVWSVFSGSSVIVDPNSNTTAVNELSLGENTFVWTVSNGACSSSDSVTINRFEQPFVNVGPDTSICAFELPINLPITVSGTATWTWDVLAGTASIDGALSTSPTFSGLTKGVTNTLLLTAQNGSCIATDTLNITLFSDESEFCTNQEVYIPAGFSPNGDGVFDFFEILNLNGRNAEVRVYNRWGNLVYESLNYQNDWGGTSDIGVQFGGDRLPEGTYYYQIQIEGETEIRNGILTIWR